jgi:hypothetical protein
MGLDAFDHRHSIGCGRDFNCSADSTPGRISLTRGARVDIRPEQRCVQPQTAAHLSAEKVGAPMRPSKEVELSRVGEEVG